MLPTSHRNAQNDTTSQQDEGFADSPLGINLPKGGVAIRGIGEKFAANLMTGTGSMTAPIATSPGRSGFGSQLSLAHDSAAGNEPFGLGWNLSLPSITRKTDKGLPRYQDAEGLDVFILYGAEDLVPVLQAALGNLPRDVKGINVIYEDDRTFGALRYRVSRYRPRIEGLFARIERWTDTQTGATHWCSITRENITTIYGKDINSRIFDPADLDPKNPTRIFNRLICATYEDKGYSICYEDPEEDSSGIGRTQSCEKHRDDQSRSANRFIAVLPPLFAKVAHFAEALWSSVVP